MSPIFRRLFRFFRFFRRDRDAGSTAGVEKDTPPAELWRVIAVSETGAGHLRSAKPCQDAHAFLGIDPDWVVIAVADGAGSAPQSEVGARAAVGGAVHQLAKLLRGHLESRAPDSQNLDPPTLQTMLALTLIAARVGVEFEAQIRSVPPRELACTLMVALLGPTLVAASGVGDGGIVVELAGGRLQTLLRPDTGEYEGETTFLTSPGAVERAHFAALPEPVESLAAFTDGLQPLVLHRKDWAPLPGFFVNVFGPLHLESDATAAGAAVRQMLCSTEVRKRTHDDVTLLVATRATPQAYEPQGAPLQAGEARE